MSHADAGRRFRLGDEKEAAGGAVAVIEVGIMDIECDSSVPVRPTHPVVWLRLVVDLMYERSGGGAEAAQSGRGRGAGSGI